MWPQSLHLKCHCLKCDILLLTDQRMYELSCNAEIHYMDRSTGAPKYYPYRSWDGNQFHEAPRAQFLM